MAIAYIPPNVTWPQRVKRLTRSQLQLIRKMDQTGATPEQFNRVGRILLHRDVLADPPPLTDDYYLEMIDLTDGGWRSDIEVPFDEFINAVE